MGKNKAVTIMVSMLLAIGLMGAAGYFGFKHFSPKTEAAEPTAEELEELMVETDEITTNLADQSYVKIKFKIQADSKDAKHELEKRLFQVNNLIIYEISNMKTADLSGQKGLINLESTLQKHITKVMQDGKVIRVYTTQKIVQ
ncbi:flagellar basal body-associated protein FliL [Fictibacillus nanhaiensis]|uniref:flagellar basal body-associated protein FliL n=1 Tax=Fictibacillus nanhaiensis TaxID=742169 RepID=UPI001C96F72A|nr:flagellar basal body-associated protein FliL [Fictibacillus nanhaiensis]MBY6036085.1 flagellar basal body-associated protein FliL [Fictibacillus nanhaiensis]